MKTLLLSILIVLVVPFNTNAQTTALAGFEVNIYDPLVNQFFDQNQNFDHIVIFYNKDEAETIEIFFRAQSGPALAERYVLTFDGDLHLFNKKYKKFPLPNATTAKLKHFQGIKKMTDVNTRYSLTTTLRRDSIKHHFSFYTFSGNTEPDFGPSGYYPTFKGDILKLTTKLEQDFKQWRPITVTDSIIILTGLVEKNGSIGKLKLVEGRTSVYSDKVLDFMGREATSWLPRFDGGGKRAWPVRISVRVNKDESIKVSIL